MQLRLRRGRRPPPGRRPRARPAGRRARRRSRGPARPGAGAPTGQASRARTRSRVGPQQRPHDRELVVDLVHDVGVEDDVDRRAARVGGGEQPGPLLGGEGGEARDPGTLEFRLWRSRPVAPPGWPPEVRPPGAPDWQRTAVAWLLDLCPPDYRAYDVLRAHPVVLARFAAGHVAAGVEAARRGLAMARADLRDVRTARRGRGGPGRLRARGCPARPRRACRRPPSRTRCAAGASCRGSDRRQAGSRRGDYSGQVGDGRRRGGSGEPARVRARDRPTSRRCPPPSCRPSPPRSVTSWCRRCRAPAATSGPTSVPSS